MTSSAPRPVRLPGRRRLTGLVVTVAAAATIIAGPGVVVPEASPRAEAVVGPVLRPAPDRYSPAGGVILTDPRNDDTKRAIFRHVRRSIASTDGGETIRIATWNLASNILVDELLRAHRRGVSVRLVMSRAVANRQKDGSYFDRLKRGLRVGNADRRPRMKSWARSCRSSCRGSGGIAHTKMYLFSQAGRSKDVVMVSSANATDVATTVQWNDVFTVIERPRVKRFFDGIFAEMGRDRWARPPFRTFSSGPYQAIVMPYQGAGVTGDPTLRELARMRCVGATGGTGADGRTIVRIAQTALVGDRGLQIAERLAQMHRRGCDIRVMTAVMGKQVQVVFDANGVQYKRYVEDLDGDGVYDRYMHTKIMAVSGVYGRSTAARVVWNGSENWSPTALSSDEAGFRVAVPRVQRTYGAWMNRLWNNPPPPIVVPETTTTARTAGTTTLDRFLQGSGDATAEPVLPPADGMVVVEPTARLTADGRLVGRLVMPDGSVVNPFAEIELH